jgi:MOSC domain-containing protein YiiM
MSGQRTANGERFRELPDLRCAGYTSRVGQVVAIWVKRAHRGTMDPVERAELIAGRGVKSSADQGGRRQITILDEAAWNDACGEVGATVQPSLRRANVLLRGVSLQTSRGRLLRLGGALVRILGEVRPCERMDEAQPGLRAALRPAWRGGAFAEILEGAEIRSGDEAGWVEELPSQLPLV